MEVAVARIRDGRARHGRGAARCERHRQRWLLGGVTQASPGLRQQFRPAGCLVAGLPGREPLGAQHGFDGRVVRLKIGPGDRPALVPPARGRISDEPLLVLAEQHVGIDERAAAQTTGYDGLEVGERPYVEKPVASPHRVPEVRREVGR